METPPLPVAAPEVDQAERTALKDRVWRHVDRMLQFRKQQDPNWIKFYRQYVSDRDQQKFPDGITLRANTFVPYPYSNVETIVSRADDVLFGYEDFFESTGRGAADQPAAEKMHKVLKVKLKKAKLPQTTENFIRTCGIYGPAGIKVDWDFGFDVVTYPEAVYFMVPVVDPMTGQPAVDPMTGEMQQQPFIHPETGQPVQTGTEMKTKLVPKNCPKFTLIDVFDLLVDPDGGAAGYITEKTFGEMQREAMLYQQKTGKELYFADALQFLAERLKDEKDPEQVIIRFAEYWNELDNTYACITTADRDGLGMKDTRYASRGSGSYSTFKRKMYAGEPILLYAGENPFAHRRCPILHTSYVKVAHEPYGIGAIEPISDLVEAMNQMISMIRDNWNLGINRRYAYDTTADIDHEQLNNVNVPGGKVAVTGDPSKVLFPLPLFTPNGGDYELFGLYKGMVEMAAGISDFYSKGVGSPSGNRTATGIQSVIQESNYRFRLFVRNLELDILQPLLEMTASNIQQFLTDEEEILITDEQAGIPKYEKVQPEELMGALSFQLLAGNYMMNEAVRQRNLLAFASIVGQSQYIKERESIIALGKHHKIAEINQLVKSEEQVAQEQQMQMQQQMQMMMMEHQMEMEKLQVAGEMKAAQAKAKDGGRGTGGKNGRPRSASQPEGKSPGAGITSPVRSVAQSLGANSLGLEGMGEVPQ